MLSCYGSGDFRPARVTETFESFSAFGIEIRTRSGRRIVSTPEHTHFAGYHGAHTPDQHLAYLMWRKDKGFRVGTTRTHPQGQHPGTSGLQLRSAMEHADAAWVLSVHDTESQARAAEALYACKYGLPTLPFVARPGRSVNGLVHDQALIDSVFAGVDTIANGLRLLSACAAALRVAPPHPAVLRGAAAQRDDHAVRRPPRTAADAHGGRGRP